jgi:hypothetical protein
MHKNLGLKTKQDRRAEQSLWWKTLLEATLVCARTGNTELAKELKQSADFWRDYKESEVTVQPVTEKPIDPDFDDFIRVAVANF